MSVHTKPGLRHRWAALAAATALFAPVLGLGGGSPALAVAAPEAPRALAAGETAATGGTLEWGVRDSIRRYLETFGHTEGWISARDGASYATGDPVAKFPLTAGVVDSTAGTASLQFGGGLEMVGFDEAWLNFENLRLDIDDGTAVLTVDLLESYNVKTLTEDIVLATFPVPSGGLAITNEQLHLTTEAGTFPEEIGLRHLPSYGGPTYGPPNDYTDSLQLRVAFGEDGAVTPDPDPTPNPDPGPDPGPVNPATGPYGTSTGTAYSDTTARIRVAPGYAINADGTTTITVRGTGFDPGTDARPSNVYVGLGTMKDPTQPEAWRRSAGGTSGPLGLADFTYGSTRLAISHFSEDGDVADAVMDASGSWELKLDVPGKDVPSFFGGDIDCVVNQCGIFAFGAHGVVKAVNEAFTPVYFDGQDETGWPARDDDDDDDGTDPPVVVPPVVEPKPEPQPDPRPEEKECVPNGTSTGKNAAGAELAVTPSQCLDDSNQKVQLTGTGYPTSRDGEVFGGVYVLFGWVDQEDPNWAPTKGGASGQSFTYANDGKPAGTFQQMVNFPGNETGPGMPTMNADGDWTMEFPIESSKFTSAQEKEIDCYQVTCGIITIGAHGLPLDGGEVFTPVYFTGDPDDTGGGKPGGNGTAGPTPNPNAPNPTGGGQTPAAANPVGTAAPLAKTGDEALRGMLLGGVLLLSAGVFTFAMLRARRAADGTAVLR